MPTLKELADRVAALFRTRSRMQFLAALFVKLVLVVGGAALAGIAQAIELAKSNGEVSAWTITGIGAAFLVALGGIFLTFTEQDASLALEAARDAISRVRDYTQDILKFGRVQADLRRVAELYSAMNAMRRVIAQALPQIDTIGIIALCLQIARRSLLIAFGFQLEEHWTIGIYIAEKEPTSGNHQLRLVAHERSIPCEIQDGRKWPIGVGVGGVAYAKSAEVIIPDLLDPALGSAFTLGDRRKPGDEERYRSMVAVPIRTDGANTPWGVAIATSDRPGHFAVEGPPGLQTVEALRALAGMVELVVSLESHLPRPSVSTENRKS